MGVVYYQYKSEKDICSMPVPSAFISVSELKQLIMTSGKYGSARSRGRLRDDLVISNAQTGEGRFVLTLNSSIAIDYCVIVGPMCTSYYHDFGIISSFANEMFGFMQPVGHGFDYINLLVTRTPGLFRIPGGLLCFGF